MPTIESIEPRELGSRLRSARTFARVTQEDAAGAIKMSRGTVVAIESGSRRVKEGELLKLAELYKVDCNTFLQPPSIEANLTPKFRRSASAKKDEDIALTITRKIQDLATAYIDLEHRLNKPLEITHPSVRKIYRADPRQQAEDMALEVRNMMGLGIGPIRDIMSIFEIDFGLRVFVVPLPSAVAGAFAYSEDLGACILINRSHPRRRQSWTFAHEFGHFMTDRDSMDFTWTSGEGDSRYSERFANHFSTSLHMPATSVRKYFTRIVGEDGRFSVRHLAYLANTFNVSLEASCRRLEDLSLLKRGTFDVLRERGLAAGGSGVSVGDLVKGDGSTYLLMRYPMIILEGYENGHLTEGQCASLLGISRIESRDLMEVYTNNFLG